MEKAARSIYLNRTCYNGLYRVNSRGEFNVPYGRYEHPDIVQRERIESLSKYLNENDITLLEGDFSFAVENAKAGDFVYFDPPYDYQDNGFTSYIAEGFSRKDLCRLKSLCDDLVLKGCNIMVSNNETEFVCNLFNDYEMLHVNANRMINSKVSGRTKAKEVIIYKTFN